MRLLARLLLVGALACVAAPGPATAGQESLAPLIKQHLLELYVTSESFTGPDRYNGCLSRDEGEPRLRWRDELMFALNTTVSAKDEQETPPSGRVKVPAQPVRLPPARLGGSEVARPIGGAVSVLAAIDIDGNVRDVLIKCSTDPGLHAAAEVAARRSTFRPATIGGGRVHEVAYLVYVFPESSSSANQAVSSAEGIVAPSPRARQEEMLVRGCRKPHAATMATYEDFVAAHPFAEQDVNMLWSGSDRDVSLGSNPAAVWPYSLRRSHETGGQVQVLVAVAANGDYVDSLVLCSDHADFSAAAIAALRAVKYAPAQREGKPVAQNALVPLNFRSH